MITFAVPRTVRRIMTLAAAMIVAVTAVIAFQVAKAPPAPAQTSRLLIGEGTGSCPAGYFCLWALRNYTGRGVAFYNSESNYAALPSTFSFINDWAWSVYNHGNTHDIRVGRDASLNGGTFVVCRGDAIPDLTIGRSIGVMPGDKWADRPSSHQFYLSIWC